MARKPKTKTRQTQTFSITAPAAQNVQLVGDFTRWQECPIALHKERSGVWSTTVNLEPGEHRYRFLIDGEWRDDPECAIRVSNPYGSLDSVCRVGG
jgi:1,4-alpha-glucan branching enzyme